MDTLFFILAFLSVIALVVGLIKPSLLKMPGRPQALVVTAGATFLFLILFVVTAPSTEKSTEKETEKETVAKVEDTKEVEEVEEVIVEPEVEIEEVEDVPDEPEPEVTPSQQNAVGMAEDYLDFTAFSKSGLIEQLKHEGFNDEDATYAVSQISVDWQEQAVDMAFNYLDYTSFSRSGLIEQLVHEGFSNEYATYAADEVGL